MLNARDDDWRTSVSRSCVMKKPVDGSVSGTPSALPPIATGRASQPDSWPAFGPLCSSLRQSVCRFVVRVMSFALNCGAKPTKNHSLSLMIGPPISNPISAMYALLLTASSDAALMGVVSAL